MQILIRLRFVGRGGPWFSFLLAAAAALCAALVWWIGYVRGSHGWRSRPPTADSGGGVAKGVPEPDGTAPLRWLPVESPSPTCRPPKLAACGVAEPNVPAPASVGACGVAAPDEAARASASTDAAR
jgi:hypothetical protein